MVGFSAWHTAMMNQTSHGVTRLPRTMPPAAAPQPPGKKMAAATGSTFHLVAKTIVGEAKRWFKAAGIQGEPIVSWDNATIHGENASGHPLPPEIERIKLPARSPDLHRVIEHTFGRLKPAAHAAAFDACRKAGTAEVPPSTVRQLVETTLERVSTAAQISADCERLKTTWKIVAADVNTTFEVDGREFVGSGGDWAPRRWR